jgi:hypothetical protein
MTEKIMPLKINVDKYPESMKGLIGQITSINPVNGQRTRNTGANVLHDVILKGGANQITLIINEADLYIFGFRNANGTFRFADKAILGSVPLPIGCSYTAATGLGVLRDRQAGVAIAPRSLASVNHAIQSLSLYNGGPVNAADLAAMCYFISEALRFKPIFQKMVRVVKQGSSFTFAEFADWVTNWANISGGAPVLVPPGYTAPQQVDLSTYF